MKHEVEQSVVEIQADRETGHVQGRFRFRGDLSVFEGHFPHFALVPGVYLIEATRILAERWIGGALRIDEVVDAKFTGEVHPDVDVSAEGSVIHGQENITCTAAFATADSKAAKIRLVLSRE